LQVHHHPVSECSAPIRQLALMNFSIEAGILLRGNQCPSNYELKSTIIQ
jgi:hypothetical protein